MLSIGQFSELSRMSRKTLHHYDQIGLLKPAYIDPDTGYRYYEANQVEQALLISRLKAYSFSLKQIKELLAENDHFDRQIRQMYQQLEILENEITLKSSTALEFRRYIELCKMKGKCVKLMNENLFEIREVQMEAKPVYEHRDIISMADFGTMYAVLFQKAGKNAIRPTGLTGAIYYDQEFDPQKADTGVFFECAEADATKILPASKAIALTHKGGYSALSESYSALAKYIQDHNLEIIAPPFEIYTKNAMQQLPMDEWETEIYFPVRG